MRSLKQTLLTSILAGTMIVVLAAGAAVYLVARANLYAQLDESLIGRAETISSLVIEEDGKLEFDYDQPIDEQNFGVLMRVIGDDGLIIAESPHWPAALASVAPASASKQDIASDFESDSLGSARHIAIARRARLDAPAGAMSAPRLSDRMIRVEVIGRTGEVDRAVTSVLIALLVGGALALLGAVVAVWFGVGRGMVPLKQFGRQVQAIEPSELRLAGAREQWPAELMPIVTALNDLLERLNAAMQRERRFTDAAAHELRTPLAELRTITDVADRWPEQERLQRSVKDAREVVDQMEELLENLLVVARGQRGEGSAADEQIRLLPLARQLAQGHDATTSHVQWSFEGSDDASWQGQRSVITAIVRNLVDNAAQYTPAGGAVTVRAMMNGSGAKLEVENGPVSIGQADIERMFEPFWRADSSRTDRTHRGLGLAIVDTLASHLHLSRDIERTDGERLRISLAPQHE